MILPGEVDSRAASKWLKANISYSNYCNYLNNKQNRFHITFIDLLYISNFKGGNATINEAEVEVDAKLISYSTLIMTIEAKFGTKNLANLETDDLNEIISIINNLCSLTNRNCMTNINGFSVSYLSALLNAYFPKLIPIIDRRVLNNLGLVKATDLDKYGQVKNIQKFYEPLIFSIWGICKTTNLSVREIDQMIFSLKIVNPYSKTS